jgi:hypothetical protein
VEESGVSEENHRPLDLQLPLYAIVNYKKGCTRLTAASDKGYQLLVHGRWFSQGTPPLKLDIYFILCNGLEVRGYSVKRHFQQYFSYMMAVSFIDGGNWSMYIFLYTILLTKSDIP